jgi:hypothetical protein
MGRGEGRDSKSGPMRRPESGRDGLSGRTFYVDGIETTGGKGKDWLCLHVDASYTHGYGEASRLLRACVCVQRELSLKTRCKYHLALGACSLRPIQTGRLSVCILCLPCLFFD